MFAWWLTLLLTGLTCMPLCMYVFRDFEDRGWLFAKPVGLLLSGWLMLILSEAHLLKFRRAGCIGMLAVVLVLNAVLFIVKKQRAVLRDINWRAILIEEAAFAAIMGIWVWIIGFNPSAYGTEKFMDYGYMTSLMRTTYLPPADTWYAGEAINYYYGGQYLSVFLVKASGVTVGEG